MKLALKTLALAVAAAAAGSAIADTATTKGGFQIKSEDGNFEAKLGGRIHFDGNFFVDEDDLSASDKTNSSFFFRRARITIEGRAYDFTYKFENDFAGQGSTSGSGFREMWIGKKVAGHNFRAGQAKPYRSMEELTSSNEILFMERPFASASGIYRQFQQGVFADGSGEGYGYGVSAYNVRAAGEASNQSLGYNARGFLVPVRSNGNILHVGASVSLDNNELNEAGTGGIADFRVRPRLVGRESGLRPTIVGAFPAAGSNAIEQQSAGLELGFRSGPFYAQAEYARVKFDQIVTPSADDADDEEVDTYYVQASYFLTDHSKPYDFAKGVFKSPKINGQEGAVELKARYDVIENNDTDAKGTQVTVGVNYYTTPNTRFMLEYVQGESEPATGDDLEASLIQARAQFNF